MKTFGFDKFTLLDSQVSLKSLNMPSQGFFTIVKRRQSQADVSIQQLIPSPSKQKTVDLSISSPENKKQYRVRPCRNNSMKEPTIEQFLSANTEKEQKEIKYKKDFEQLYTDFGTYLADMKVKLQEEKDKRTQQLRQAKTKIQFKKIQQITDQSSHRVKDADSEQLNEQIHQLHQNIDVLKQIWKNDQRLAKYIIAQISLKQEVSVHLSEYKVDFTLHHLLRIFKNPTIVHKKNLIVEFSEMNQNIINIIQQSKLQDLANINASINELAELPTDYHKLFRKYNIKSSGDSLSYKSTMMHNANKDIMLEKSERILGQLQLVSFHNRQLNQSITNNLEKLKYLS